MYIKKPYFLFVILLFLAACGGFPEGSEGPHEEPKPVPPLYLSKVNACYNVPTGNIGGRIYNGRTNANVVNATINFTFGEFCSTSNSTQTDSNGRYSITLPGGTYTVTIAAAGYQTRVTSITVTASASNVADRYIIPFPPNFEKYIKQGYSDTIVVTNSETDYIQGTPSACQTAYIHGAFWNNSYDDVTTPYNFSIYVDGTRIVQYRSTSLYAHWHQPFRPTYNFSAGLHTVRVELDTANEVSETNESDNSFQKTFNFSDCAPTTLITSPTQGSSTSVSSIDVQVTCRDEGENLSRGRLYNRTTGESRTEINIPGDVANIRYTSMFLIPGYNSFETYCDDSNGNNSSANVGVTYTPPNNAPTIRIWEPSGGQSFTSSTQLFRGTCYDNDSNLSSVSIRNETTGWSPIPTNMSGSEANFSANITLQPGSNTLSATCQDTAGRTAGNSVSVTYDVCPNESQKDGIGDPCNHSDCANGSPWDNYNNVCLHDEDGDEIDDDSDACPGQSNDAINNPCDPNDNANFNFSGEANIDVNTLYGNTNQTQQFSVSNNGTINLIYSFQLSSASPWLHLVKNGGDTTALENSHSLPPGQRDTFTASLNSNLVAPGQTVSTTLQVSASNDSSDGIREIPISLTAEQAPFCSGTCNTAPSQLFGNQQIFVQTVSDPINTATGNYSYQHTDLILPARGLDLTFARTYNSQDKYLGPMGFGWTHTFNMFLVPVGEEKVTIKWPDGHYEVYTDNGDNTFAPPTGIFSSLTQEAMGSYLLITKNGTFFRFSESGQWTEMEDSRGNKLTLRYDDKNRLEKVEDLTGKFLNFLYADEESLKIISISDTAGRTLIFGYDEGDLTSFTGAEGHVYRYIYDALHQLTSITDPRNHTLVSNTYDSFSRVTEQRDSLNQLTQIQYETPGVGQVTITDPSNQSFKQIYDNQLRIVESQDPLGHAVQYQYNTNNLRTLLTDRTNKNLNADYDSKGNVISLTDPIGAITQFEYDPESNNLTKIIYASGHERNFEYDNEKNLTRIWELNDETLHETQYEYNEWGQATHITDPEGNMTTFVFDATTGNLESITNPKNETTHFVFDNANQLESVTNPLEKTTRFEYNSNNNITKVVDPDNLETLYTYDENGNLISTRDRMGNITTFRWNNNNLLEAVRNALGNEITFTYDSLNRRTLITNPENRSLQFYYNAAGFLESLTDPSGKSISYERNNEGKVTSKTDTAGQIWNYTYNDRGQIETVTNPLRQTVQLEFDNETGLLTLMTDPQGNTTQLNYDVLGRLISITDPLHQTTFFEYDKRGLLTSLTNVANQITTFTYDKVGRKEGQTNALGEREQYFYDLAGQLSRFVDEKNQETQYSYDVLGRPSTITLADETVINYTYDANSNRKTVADSSGTTYYTYDSLNRLTDRTDPNNFALHYKYNLNGLLSQLTYPGDKTVSYTYNPSQQLASVTDWLGNATQYDYDNAGRLSQVSLPNGFETTYHYDELSRLIQLTNRKSDGSTLTHYNMTLNENGLRAQITREGELVPWILPEETDSIFNLENALLSMGNFNFGYDANGNLMTLTEGKQTTTYGWDVQDRLTAVTAPDQIAEFTYDGEGNRIEKNIDSQITKFIVDSNHPLPNVIAETNEEGAIQSYYIHGLGLISKTSADASQINYYHYDPIGSTVALSNTSGDITDQYLYDAFGNINRRTGNTPNPFQYVGQLGIQNDETGLFYMRARYYNPESGKFISRDPIGLVGGLNGYLYGNQNPISQIDPSGLTGYNYCPANSTGGLTGEEALGITEGSLWGFEQLATLGSWKDVSLKTNLLPFEIGLKPATNVAGNLRGQRIPGTGDLLKLGVDAGKVSRLIMIAEMIYHTAVELPKGIDNVLTINSSPELTHVEKAGGIATESILTVGRIGANLAIDTLETIPTLLRYSSGNPNSPTNIISSAQNLFMPETMAKHNALIINLGLDSTDQWLKDRQRDIDWWTAMNVRDAVQDIIYPNQNLSGGVSTGLK